MRATSAQDPRRQCQGACSMEKVWETGAGCARLRGKGAHQPPCPRRAAPVCVHGLKHTRSQDAYCQGPIMPCVCAWPEAHKESGCLPPRSHHALCVCMA